MRRKLFVSLMALLTFNAMGMNGQKALNNTKYQSSSSVNIDQRNELLTLNTMEVKDQETSSNATHQSLLFAGVERRNISDNPDMKRSYSCPTELKIDQQHREKINNEVSKAPAKPQVQKEKKKKTLSRTNSDSELCVSRGISIDTISRCRSTDSLFSFPNPNPIRKSFPCTNLASCDQSIIFFCIRHCKDKANLNNTTHSQNAFNQFDIRAFNQSDVYMLKIIGELLRPNKVFGGSHSRHSITASLFGWELTQTSSLNEQNLGRLIGRPLSEVIKHHSFQKMINDANYSTGLEGESGNQELIKLRNFINAEKEAFEGQRNVLIPLISSNCTLNWLARLVTGNLKLNPMIIPNLGIFVFQIFPKTGIVEYVVDQQRNLKIFELSEFLSFIFECPAFQPFINPEPLSNAEAMISSYNMLGNSSDSLQFIYELLNLLGSAGNSANNNVIINNVRSMLTQISSPRGS